MVMHAFAIFGVMMAIVIGVILLAVAWGYVVNAWEKVKYAQQHEFWKSRAEELQRQVEKLEEKAQGYR